MEANVAEVGTRLGSYLLTQEKRYKDVMFKDVKEFREALARFKQLRLTASEIRLASDVEQLFDQTLSLIQEIVALNEFLESV